MLSLLAAAALIAASPAQDQTPQSTAVDDVVVEARPLDRQIRSFLSDIAVPDRSLNVARWHEKVCVGVVNMRGQSAQYVADRISLVADDLGLQPGEPGCSANILVIASTNGAEMARGLVDARPLAFNPGGDGMVRGRSALRKFTDSDAAIRWWHVAVPIDSNSGRIATRMPGEDAPQISAPSSRLRTEIRNDLSRVIIILDFDKLGGLNLQQVADYAAMVAFSQVDADADFSGYDSILALTEDRTVQGLTDWDMAYLKALYSAELNQAQRVRQQGEIARLMEMRHVRPAATEPASR
ncbi:hypothetical protein [uncultured Brevundimonas sp.]|uniref:hypothetical protein n=1 Tax=uncultured Brevundimonas sp. TaxID=213418 RepID=UPI00262F9F30|nr:hypothetical protein [uncultured Brevundimonas sp.]